MDSKRLNGYRWGRMKAVSATAVVSASLMGGLFEPTFRRFPGGIGEALNAALLALDGQRVIAIERVGADNFDLRMIPAADVAGVQSAQDAEYTAGTSITFTSSLPAGGTKRYAWTSNDDGAGALALTGPLAAGIYSLEDFVNALADGGFTDELSGASHALASFAVGDVLLVDQEAGDIHLFSINGGTDTAIKAAVSDAEVSLTAESAKWE